MEERIYSVSQSAMVQALVDEACGMLIADQLIHYFIVTDNDCIDVIVRDGGDKPQLEYRSAA